MEKNNQSAIDNRQSAIINPPNILTLSRFVFAILFMVCLSVPFSGATIIALILFAVAALTDALDGYLARKIYGCTDFGKLMDPLADKVLTAAAFIGFAGLRLMPAWMVTLIISREMMVTGLRLLAAEKGVVLAAGAWGKHKTVWQMVYIIAVLIARPFGVLTQKTCCTANWTFAFAVTGITLWSGIVYFRENFSLLKK
ncbi:MAG: CDP-diacylglycerol--glycerol-3-phosphate 3-phosphatidyltransferase [Kiritimatiellales bacterium]